MQFTEQVRKYGESLEVRTPQLDPRQEGEEEERERKREGGRESVATSEEKTKKKERQRECLGSGWGPNSLGAQK